MLDLAAKGRQLARPFRRNKTTVLRVTKSVPFKFSNLGRKRALCKVYITMLAALASRTAVICAPKSSPAFFIEALHGPQSPLTINASMLASLARWSTSRLQIPSTAFPPETTTTLSS
jgi:hypothetical protein